MPIRFTSRYRTSLLVDSLLAALAMPLAAWLDAPGAVGGLSPLLLLGLAAGVGLLVAAGLVATGAPRGSWRHPGLPDLLRPAAGSALGVLAGWPLGLYGLLGPGFSPLLPILVLAFAWVLLGATRLAARIWREGRRAGPERAAEREAELAWLIGAGDGAELFLRALSRERSPRLRVGGLLSTRPDQLGRRVLGQKVIGTVAEAEALLDAAEARGEAPLHLILTEAFPVAEVDRLLDAVERRGARLSRMSSPVELQAALQAPEPGSIGQPSAVPRVATRLAPVAIEDLLERPPVSLDRDAMARLVQGARVLVTGAGGTIGGELCRQIAALGPETLTLVDHAEFLLWQIDVELGERAPQLQRRVVLADIRDRARIDAVVAEAQPDLVFHAAALKHVPMVEANPLEGLTTNAVGTRNVADAARRAGARAMVLISTDKAVNPASVMGASKRLAEMYCQALDLSAQQAGAQAAGAGSGRPATRFVTVRFGNVLGSTGSVVPLFRRQLERGGPLTVTHPDMRRYFMTVTEAVGLVLQAMVLGVQAGATASRGGIFVLDMGEPVRILDLARRLIRLAGLRPEVDVGIVFTGLRPGEKLDEELFHGGEALLPTAHSGILTASLRSAEVEAVGRALDAIGSASAQGQVRAALAQLALLVPEFDHRAAVGRG